MFKFYNNWNDSKCQNLILFNQFFNSNFSLTNLKREISVLPRNFKHFCLKYIWLIFIIYFIRKEKVNLVYEMSIQTENKSYKYYMKILIEASIWNYLIPKFKNKEKLYQVTRFEDRIMIVSAQEG